MSMLFRMVSTTLHPSQEPWHEHYMCDVAHHLTPHISVYFVIYSFIILLNILSLKLPILNALTVL